MWPRMVGLTGAWVQEAAMLPDAAGETSGFSACQTGRRRLWNEAIAEIRGCKVGSTQCGLRKAHLCPFDQSQTITGSSVTIHQGFFLFSFVQQASLPPAPPPCSLNPKSGSKQPFHAGTLQAVCSRNFRSCRMGLLAILPQLVLVSELDLLQMCWLAVKGSTLTAF